MSDCGNVQKVFVPDSVDPDQDKFDLAKKEGLLITDYAAEKIASFLIKDKKSADDYGLKVSVVKDGCSGLSYTMDLAKVDDLEKEGAKIFKHLDIVVMVEKAAYLYVFGSILDYVESLTGSGFNLKNPNVKRSCSCGSSFAI